MAVATDQTIPQVVVEDPQLTQDDFVQAYDYLSSVFVLADDPAMTVSQLRVALKATASGMQRCIGPVAKGQGQRNDPPVTKPKILPNPSAYQDPWFGNGYDPTKYPGKPDPVFPPASPPVTPPRNPNDPLPPSPGGFGNGRAFQEWVAEMQRRSQQSQPNPRPAPVPPPVPSQGA